MDSSVGEGGGEGVGPYMGLLSSSVVHIWQIDYFAKCSNMSLELHSKAFLFMGVGRVAEGRLSYYWPYWRGGRVDD